MKKQKVFIKIIYSFAVVSGLSAMGAFFYPTISDAWNRYVSYKAISDYTEQEGTGVDYTETFEKAEKYNSELFAEGKNNISKYTYKLSGDTSENTELSGEVLHPDEYYESQIAGYKSLMMGYIEIDKIGVKTPIYHYTSDEVLDKGIGHLYGSSLPIGGENTHAVLTGHCGLMEAKLFTDLEKLTEGDVFSIHVLNKKLNYQVDQILKVKPSNFDALGIEEGKDYVTLVTCTPYGINSHRLLVRGHRIEDSIEKEKKTFVQQTVEIINFPITIFVLTGITLLIGLIILFRIWKK